MNIEHTDVAAYALGLLDARDREDFEAHLADCESCAAELAEFAAMADLFAEAARVELDDAGPDEAAVVDLLSRRAVVTRRRNIQRGWLAAVACLVLLVGGAVAGAAAAPRHSGLSSELQGSTQFHAVNPAQDGIVGTVGLIRHAWGTEVILQLSHLALSPARGPLDCELIAVAKSGEVRVLMGWLVHAPGLGVPGHPADLLIEGGTSIPMNKLKSIRIQVVPGPTLLTFPV